jgi:hypothetical protein
MNRNKVNPSELETFVAVLSERHNSGLRAAYPTCELNWSVVVCEPGRKYARLVTENPTGNSRSALGFIDLTNGDILKADGWKAPAKHARGNIRQGDASNLWNGAFTAHSGLFVAYLR